MKRALLISSAAVAITAIAAPIAALDVDVSGRVRFTFTDTDLSWNMTAPAANVGSAASRGFSTDGRVDFNASASTCCLNYGSFVRFDFNEADTTGTPNSLDDVDAHIWLSGDDWGKLQLGSDIDAKQGVFDTSVVAAGPMYSGMGVDTLTVTAAPALVAAPDGFNTAAITNSSIVYTAPAMMGLTPKVEIDADGDWAASVKYSGEFGGASVSLVAYMDEADATAVMATASMGDFKAAVFTGSDDSGEEYMGGGVNYSMGALSFSADMSNATSDGLVDTAAQAGEEDQVVLGMGYTIAPGLSFGASYSMQEVTYTTPGVGADVGTSEQDIVKARLTLNF